MNDANKDAQGGEPAWIELIDRLVGPGQRGETWIGDDAAVVNLGVVDRLLFAGDLLVQGVHFDLSICSVSDVGWKALAVNLSDMAAMGGRPLRAIVSIAGAGLIDLELLYRGLLEVGGRFDCPIVGGDLSSGDSLVISVAVIGTAGDDGPILRSGAVPADVVFVTGPLGASAAGLRLLRGDASLTGPLVNAHRRPVPRLLEGSAAASGGASAMIDISDGLAIDLHRIGHASRVGFAIDDLPVADGATYAEAVGGGEDYELLFTAPDVEQVNAAFDHAGLSRPHRIGTVVDEGLGVTAQGVELPALGFTHR